MRRLQINHLTTYQYTDYVTLLPHKLLLRPREDHNVRIETAELTISPTFQLQWHRDVFDNAVAQVTFLEPANLLSITSRVVIQHYDDQPLNFLVAEHAVSFPFIYDASERNDLEPYLSMIFSQDQPVLSSWLEPFWKPGQQVETYLLLEWINKGIAQGLTYLHREGPGVQTPAETISSGRGSCRDFAALFIESCRSLGLAARFVSGYLYSPFVQQNPGATHAWSEVYLPGAGWKGFDSTSGLIVGNEHIAVAVSRHPEEVPPVSGSFFAPPHAPPQTPVMHVEVEVNELAG